MLDLDQKAAERAAERAGQAARHGARGDVLPIQWRGQEIAALPAELPLETLEPLRVISSDVALLVRSAMQMQGSDGGDTQREGTQMIIDLLSANEDLPNVVISVLTGIARNALGPDGYDRFVEGKPSLQDAAALAAGALEWWGLSLGDLFGPSSSPEPDGSTSAETSSDGITSMPEASGAVPVSPDSSESPTS